jgi:hypothetical protein
MPTNVKSIEDLKQLLAGDISRLMDQTIWLAIDYADGYINRAYRGECQEFWPLMVNGEEAVDPVTGEEFTEEENPENILRYLDVSYAKISETIRSGTIWINALGFPEAQKMERAARMQEIFGCRPWSKLKTQMSEQFGDIVKQHGETVRNRFGLK